MNCEYSFSKIYAWWFSTPDVHYVKWEFLKIHTWSHCLDQMSRIQFPHVQRPKTRMRDARGRWEAAGRLSHDELATCGHHSWMKCPLLGARSFGQRCFSLFYPAYWSGLWICADWFPATRISTKGCANNVVIDIGALYTVLLTQLWKYKIVNDELNFKLLARIMSNLEVAIRSMRRSDFSEPASNLFTAI